MVMEMSLACLGGGGARNFQNCHAQGGLQYGKDRLVKEQMINMVRSECEKIEECNN